MSFRSIKPRSRVTRTPENSILVGVCGNGTGNPSVLKVRMGLNIMRQVGIAPGDSVDFQIGEGDDEGVVRVVKANDGYKVSGTTSGFFQVATPNIWDDERPLRAMEPIKRFSVTDGEIQFRLPLWAPEASLFPAAANE